MANYDLNLDEFDLMLVKELEINARQSTSELATKLGRKTTTVYRRLQRLLKAGVITFAVITDPKAMGFEVAALIGINAHPGKADAVADHIESFRRFGSTFQTTGRYDLLHYTVFRNHREMFDFVDKDLGSSSDLSSVDPMIVFDSLKSSWRYLGGDDGVVLPPSVCETDQVDLALISLLEADPRETITGMAEKLGMNRIIAGKKLQALMEANIVRVVSIVDPQAFDFQFEPVIFIQTRPGKIDEVANVLIPDRRITHLVTITGSFNIYVRAIFRDLDDMSQFLKNDLGNVPGITHHETMMPIGRPRRLFALLSNP